MTRAKWETLCDQAMRLGHTTDHAWNLRWAVVAAYCAWRAERAAA